MKTRTTTTPIEKEQTIIFTNNETSTGQSQESTMKTSRKKNQQRKERRKNKEQIRETEKMFDVICMYETSTQCRRR